jgi:hypothetical protein
MMRHKPPAMPKFCCKRSEKQQARVGRPTQARTVLLFHARLGRDDCDDFQRSGIDDHDLILNEEVIESSVLRNNPHDFFRQQYEVHIPWNPSPNRNAKVHVFAEPRAMLTPRRSF